jgi:hypothetical protein
MLKECLISSGACSFKNIGVNTVTISSISAINSGNSGPICNSSCHGLPYTNHSYYNNTTKYFTGVNINNAKA